ncbi:hypothetical protein F5883DRAFT_520559 [Diaporthe sp. PMI_573]|nr:hypothetical protein F5883DRAFT_520559 [Diaporthaceae sp. PMI_573]
MATTTAGKDRMPCLVGAAMQIALVDVLAKWNVHPTASFAHHGGEFLAAYSSGHLSAPEVLLLLDCAATGQDSHAKIRELNNEDLAWRRPSTTVASLVPGDALDILLSRSTTRGSMPKETNGYERSLAETFENIEVDNIVEIGQSSRLPDQMNTSHERITALWECRSKAVSFSETLVAAGALYILGYPVDLEEANAVHGVDWKPMLLVDLPPYQWDHSRSMIIESHALREERLCGVPYHELLGRRVHGLSPRSMIWKNSFVQDNVTWLYGSRPTATLSAALCLSLTIEALTQAFESRRPHEFALRDFVFQSPLPPIKTDEILELQTCIQPIRSRAAKEQTYLVGIESHALAFAPSRKHHSDECGGGADPKSSSTDGLKVAEVEEFRVWSSGERTSGGSWTAHAVNQDVSLEDQVACVDVDLEDETGAVASALVGLQVMRCEGEVHEAFDMDLPPPEPNARVPAFLRPLLG